MPLQQHSHPIATLAHRSVLSLSEPRISPPQSPKPNNSSASPPTSSSSPPLSLRPHPHQKAPIVHRSSLPGSSPPVSTLHESSEQATDFHPLDAQSQTTHSLPPSVPGVGFLGLGL